MSPRQTLRGVLATTLAGFALVANALPQPEPQAQVTVAPSPKVWVHVDASTIGATITPTVTTDANGAKNTVNPPPEYLTRSKEYSSWREEDGVMTTYTSLNPAPSATGTRGAQDPRGEFLACLPQPSGDEPFCAPKRDARLQPDRGYYSESPSLLCVDLYPYPELSISLIHPPYHFTVMLTNPHR